MAIRTLTLSAELVVLSIAVCVFTAAMSNI